MRIELTVDQAGARRDVAVTAPAAAPLADLLPALVGEHVAAAATQVWVGDRMMRPTISLAAAGLRVGSVLSIGRRPGRPTRTSVLALHVVGGPAAGLIVALERGRLVLGRDADCDITLPDADVSRRHAVLDVSATAITLLDLGSTNGTTVGGRSVPSAGVAVRPGELIALGDSLLTVVGPADAPATLQPGDDGTCVLLRPPRRRAVVAEREIVLPTRSSSMRPRGAQWITALLPALAGAAIAWFAHSPQFLLFALLSPLMMLSTALGDRVHWRRSRRRDAVTFRRRRALAEQAVADALAAETAARRAAAPDPAAVLRHVALPSDRLWERRRGDGDLLRLRVGTAELPSTARTRAGSAVAAAGVVSAVPLDIDLRAGVLGLAGPPDVLAGSSRWLIGQLAALHSPADVELALLLSPGRSDDWWWARWLPHLRGRVAETESQWVALVADLAAVVDRRLAGHRADPDGWPGPWLVLVVDRASLLAEVPGLIALLARGSGAGVAAICLDVDVGGLPTSCATVARVSGVTGSRVLVRSRADRCETSAVLDQVSAAWAAEIARGLAPLVDAGTSGSAALPTCARLLDTLALDDLDTATLGRRWAASSGRAQTTLGRSADGPLQIDLVADGPHALIAGTTGSGKSELLQTLVAGLATSHPPDEINFLLVDYKGGAAFAECVRLPHTAGLVTDLDPYLTERALRALHSELRRRERLFAAAGTADLTGYRLAATGEPVPRLIIVVDEFAALIEELPDFVRGLIGVAQRGRSLGVHLVLATQRPGSAVSAEIRANTSLRIALRVTDPGESTDILDSPSAASIERDHPGRGYLRVGSTLTCFQAAHAGAVRPATEPRARVEPLDRWRRTARPDTDPDARSDIARLVDALCAAAEKSGRAPARSPWLAPLPDSLPRRALGAPAAPGSVAVARVDLPDEQRSTVLALDLDAGGSLLAVGTGRAGRTGLLASLGAGAADQLGPAALNLHVIDATGALGAVLGTLPHCATVLGPDELSLAPRLLRLLERECARRVASVRRADPASLLLLVDGWDAMTAALPDLDVSACGESLASLLRIGPAAGLTVAVTGDRALLSPRFAGTFATRIALRLADRADYGLAGIAVRDVPTSMPPGRGLRAGDAAVLQVAHAGSAPGPVELQREIAATARRWAGAGGPGTHAIRVRALPGRVALGELPHLPGRLSIGLAGDEVRPVALDPFAGAARLLVAGPPRSGRTTMLRSLVRQAEAAGFATLVAATSRSALATDARAMSVRVVGPGDDLGRVPSGPTLLLVDDSEAFLDSPVGDHLTSWVRSPDAPLAAVVAGRADDLATTYRGIAAEVRRSHCGILLRPGPIDGELLGVRLPRRPSGGPPGRGVAVGDPSWGPLFDDGEPVPIQVATP